jgi:hypothetical protein
LSIAMTIVLASTQNVMKFSNNDVLTNILSRHLSFLTYPNANLGQIRVLFKYVITSLLMSMSRVSPRTAYPDQKKSLLLTKES